MELSVSEKKDISDYIFNSTKYVETYNELYDHILNSFEDSEVAFSIDHPSFRLLFQRFNCQYCNNNSEIFKVFIT